MNELPPLPPELEDQLQDVLYRYFRDDSQTAWEVCNIVRPMLQRQQADVERLKAEVVAWRERFPVCFYDGKRIVMGG